MSCISIRCTYDKFCANPAINSGVTALFVFGFDPLVAQPRIILNELKFGL
jgi:hypothetical protein